MLRVLRPISLIVACVVSACGTPAASQDRGVLPLQAQASARVLKTDPIEVVDQSSNLVFICKPNCTKCKTIGGGLRDPMGIAVGPWLSSGAALLLRRSYVADADNSRIVVFTTSCSTQAVLDDGGYLPMDVAVAIDGTVAVTNRCTAPSCNGSGNIAFYAPGSRKRTSVATGLMSNYFFGDFDKNGNFYNDGLTPQGTTAIGVVARGSTIDHPTGITGINRPGGIQVARNGTLNIDDPSCSCIQIFNGSRHVGTVTLSGTVSANTFAFTRTNSDIWVADSSTRNVYEFPYPAGGSSINVLRGFSEPLGVAVSPPDRP